ncbi:MAG: helix-turn-helix family protein [Rhizobacter sp.]|nr:helix-turn-helix family protein [Rhizobacter sp.]
MSSTVKGVAKRANVSAATVSLVLNGKSGISEETRAKVLQAASELNYAKRPGKSAQADRSGTLRFLKIAKHGHTVNRDHNIFISDYIDGMSGEANLLGYKLEIVSFEGEAIEKVVASIAGAAIDGAIVLGTELTEADIQLFQAAATPLVIIDTFCDFSECNFVNMNNKDAVYKIVSHFVENGFKNIGFIGSNVQTINFHLRKAAFLETMKKFGLSFNAKDIVTVDSTYDGAYEDMRAKLNAGLIIPDCYFCTNDIITYGCIKAFREFNVRIPQDLSIVGFDNLPMSATMDPPLTTIDVSKQKIGCLAVRNLDELIKSKKKQPSVKILVGAELVVRKSVMRKAPAAGSAGKRLKAAVE